MTRTYQYNKETVKHVFKQLMNFKNQGNTKDFEVRIDDLTVVGRTNNLENFRLFKKSLTSFCETVRILIYKGNSRKYDQYILTRNVDNEARPNLAPQEYLKQKLDEWISKEKKEIDFARLKEENKQLKKQLKKSETRNETLQAKKSIDLEGIMKVAAQIPQLMGNKNESKEKLPEDLNGTPTTDLLGMINSYRENWGEEIFQRVLGVTITLGNDLELLKTVEELIKEKGGKNGSEG